MINDIKLKLEAELNKRILGEPQVIYILSRIRKILEINGKQKEDEYKKLKFYCDWALHPIINNVGAVQDILHGIITHKAASGADLTVNFKTLHDEFRRFFKEYDLSNSFYISEENKFGLEMYLSQIYADTPLIIDGKIKVEWLGQFGEKSFGGSFKVTDLSKPNNHDLSSIIKS